MNSEEVRTSPKISRTILDAKYEKADFNKEIKKQWQHLPD